MVDLVIKLLLIIIQIKYLLDFTIWNIKLILEICKLILLYQNIIMANNIITNNYTYRYFLLITCKFGHGGGDPKIHLSKF